MQTNTTPSDAGLKIPEHLFRTLHLAVSGLDTDDVRAQYRAGDFPRADAVKDLDKRYRWDLFWAASKVRVGGGNFTLLSAINDSGLQDSHIDSALRRIVAPL